VTASSAAVNRTAQSVVGIDHVRWFQSYSSAHPDQPVTWTNVSVHVRLSVPTAYGAQAGYVVDVSRLLRRVQRAAGGG
jgi:hypothetical protein